MTFSTSGILLIDKASGVSSAGEINRVKKKLGLARVGHCGTLDPMATGLLVVLSGAATRLADYIQSGIKTYSGVIRLGVSTSTDDIEGEVLSSSSLMPTFAEIKKVAQGFVGSGMQLPPQFSAIKVNGERSYRIAREGGKTELVKRPIEIKEFAVEMHGESEVSFEVVCSKGTYIRSLARDMGQILGCGACLSALRREVSEPFRVSAAKTVEDISRDDILDWRQAFPGIPSLALDDNDVRRLLAGDQRVLASLVDGLPREELALNLQLNRRIAIYEQASTGRPLGLLVNEDSAWKIACTLVNDSHLHEKCDLASQP